MTISLELTFEFLDGEGVPLTVADLEYGMERGWICGETAIRCAVRSVERGDGDAVMLAVASLLSDEVDELPVILASSDSPSSPENLRRTQRKWIYLLLAAAYDARGRLRDPLEAVEEIYADLDYPVSIERFVRYMPLHDGDEAGEPALIGRWAAFLRREGEDLGA